MKALVRLGTKNIVGNFSFNKTLNMYKLIRGNNTLYIPSTSISYVVDQTPKRKTSKRKTRR